MKTLFLSKDLWDLQKTSMTNMMFEIQALHKHKKMELKNNQKKDVKVQLYIRQALNKTIFSRIMEIRQRNMRNTVGWIQENI